jgi:xanthine dehydrogenase accessory factor
MIIKMDDSSFGTVGGGPLEARVIQLAKTIFDTHAPSIEHFTFTSQDAAIMDAICGGEVDVLIEWINPTDPAWQTVVSAIEDATSHHEKGWFLTLLPSESADLLQGKQEYIPDHIFVRENRQPVSSITATDWEIPMLPNHFSLVSIRGKDWINEPLRTGGTVLIFGAGHVGRSLALFTRVVGFHTVVLDDRPEYASRENVPDAHEIILLPSFGNVFESISANPDTYIVIVTRGHLYDRSVLEQALRTDAAYIGMIGSRRKCALIFEELRKAGFQDEDINRVHAPIGLWIKAETPEEIGVSITAQLIQSRAEKNGESAKNR